MLRAFLLIAALQPQSADTIPTDTYRDHDVAVFMERARAARGAEVEDLENYEATVTQRVYVGLNTSSFRRERGLFLMDRVARIRWVAGGPRIVRWRGWRMAVPIAGDKVEVDYDRDETIETFPYDPTGDRLVLAGSPFLNPLADTAVHHYRYASGDTMRMLLPRQERTITLVEVLIEPRKADFGLLAGGLWFEAESGALVRAYYRPARPFDLEMDEPEESDEVPGFLKPVVVTIDYMTIDYGLQELRWWLPNRLGFEGQMRMRDAIAAPVTLEWSVRDYAINQESDIDLVGDLPEGWTRIVTRDCRSNEERRERRRQWRNQQNDAGDILDEPEEDEDLCPDGLPPDSVIIITPPDDSLISSPELPPPSYDREPLAFKDDELAELRTDLGKILLPPPEPGRVRFVRPGFPDLVRYNRIEALSIGARLEVPTWGYSGLSLTGRLGIADLSPNVVLELRQQMTRSVVKASGYHRLVSAADWGNPLTFGNSLNTFFLGYDNGQYYRTAGMSVEGSTERGRATLGWRLFGEYQYAAEKGTNVSIPDWLFSDTLNANIIADKADLIGASGRIDLQYGVGSNDGGVLLPSLWGDAATGTFEYWRLAGQVAYLQSLFGALRGAVELSAGTTGGDVPTQRLYFLGGPYTLRGFEIGNPAGSAYWFGRLEIGNNLPAFRVMAFGDFGWAGSRDDFGSDTKIGVGLGVSALDGIFRIDLGHAVRGGNDWRLYIYSDGLM